MISKIIKRDGTEVPFNEDKIFNAISKANDEVDRAQRLDSHQLNAVTGFVVAQLNQFKRAVEVEEIQEIVETEIMKSGAYEVAKRYIRYRYDHKLKREDSVLDKKIMSIVEYENEDAKQENSNKNPEIIPTQRDYMAGEVSKDMTLRKLLTAKIVEAHESGIIHFHDSDYFLQHSHNCDLVNVEDMHQNNTVISGTLIESPHTFSIACNIATQEIAQVASCQYGGQSISIAHLAPFVNNTRKRVRERNKKLLEKMTQEEFDEWVEEKVREDITTGVQTIQYQVVTLMTTNGQAPFITVYLNINEARSEEEQKDLANIIEEVLRQRIQGVKNEKGVWVTPAFPKLVYALDENNVYPDSKFFYLTVLAAQCTSKRMVPDYISNKIERQLKFPPEKRLTIKERRDRWGSEKMWGRNPFKDMTDDECDLLQEVVGTNFKFEDEDHLSDIVKAIIEKYHLTNKDLFPQPYTCMGCRSFLTPDHIHYKSYGRFNQGVVTINLPDVALSSGGDFKLFDEILDDRLENICYPALMARHNRLKGTLSSVAPILWQHGALARLGKHETIDPLLYDGYSTISLGYAGLYECVKYMTGESHTAGGKEFALHVMKTLNAYTAKWREQTNIDFSLYGTPLESTTYKFAKCLQKRFGIIEGVTDKNYITNSYHVHVTEPIDAFTKLSFEAEFQALSPGGAISYIEVPNMTNNIEAVIKVIQYIYENIMYAELNTRSDYCHECGFEGEIQIVKDDAEKLVWECPVCGNRDQSKMNVARRTCGYIGTNFWNQGRTQEISERVLHL